MRVSVPAWDKGGPGLGRAVEYDLLDSGFMAAKMNSSQNGYSLGIRWSVAFTLDHQHLSYGCCCRPAIASLLFHAAALGHPHICQIWLFAKL